jgi:hypothetical protein
MSRSITVCAIALAALAATVAAASGQARVQTGVLECRGAGATSYVVGSAHQLACVFQSDHGTRYRYYGTLRRAGLDIGFTEDSGLGWAVFAPTNRIGPGDLAGNYGGVTAGAAVGLGANANVLVGGSNNSFALQPLSLERQVGLNVAVGIAGLELRYADGGPYRRVRSAHSRHRHHLKSHSPV